MSQFPDLRGGPKAHFGPGLAARIAAATVILAVVVGLAVWLHGYRVSRSHNGRSGTESVVFVGREHPSWADSLAAGLVIAGLGTATALLLVGRR